jgi:hypothetical protein
MVRGDMKILIASALAALSLAACASGPKPCTTEWVAWKTDRIYADFRQANREPLANLQELNSALSVEGGTGTSGLLTLVALAPAVVRMMDTFIHDTVPEVQSAVGQCGNAPGASTLLADFLRQEGVSERATDAIERFGRTLTRS